MKIQIKKSQPLSVLPHRSLLSSFLILIVLFCLRILQIQIYEYRYKSPSLFQSHPLRPSFINHTLIFVYKQKYECKLFQFKEFYIRKSLFALRRQIWKWFHKILFLEQISPHSILWISVWLKYNIWWVEWFRVWYSI